MIKLIKIGILTFSLAPMVAIASTPSSSSTSVSPQFEFSQSFQTKLKKSFKNSKWVEQTQKDSGSNITSGWDGTIFEDSRGNLWSMGYGTPLQKYNYQTKRWIIETSVSSGNNITNGQGGTIFEDSRGNLWSMGWGTPLQKYDYNTKRWNVETRVSSGNNITDGDNATLFEDSRGNLWSMGSWTPLQKYNYQTKRWTPETSGSSGNNITNGRCGTLFEDSRGNLWSMGYITLLQKLMPLKIKNAANWPTKNYNLKFKTRIILNSKISLSIQGFRKYKSNSFSYLEYKKQTESEWKVVKNKNMFLDRANYEFRWVLGTEEILVGEQGLPQKVSLKSDGSVETITPTIPPSDIAKVKTFLSTLLNSDISSLTIYTKLFNIVAKLEVLALIQAASGYSELTKDQQALIALNLISLSEDPIGTLKVVITFKGETYELMKKGFKFNLQVEANKFQDFTSNDTIKSNAASLKASSKNVINIFKKISGYQRPTNLASDIAITQVIVKNPLNSQTRKTTFQLTISYQGEEVKKDVNVTFKALNIIAKPSKKYPSGLSTEAIVGISLGSIFGIGTISFLAFYFVRRNRK